MLILSGFFSRKSTSLPSQNVQKALKNDNAGGFRNPSSRFDLAVIYMSQQRPFSEARFTPWDVGTKQKMLISFSERRRLEQIILNPDLSVNGKVHGREKGS